VVLTPQWLASSLSEACRPDRVRMCHIRKATEARKPDTPGRARYKPSNHCVRERRVIPGYSLLLVCFLPIQVHTRPRVQRASGIPHALKGAEDLSTPRAHGAARSRTCVCRHCEPTGRANARPMTGSAKQSISPRKGRMDCFAALAMTITAPYLSRHRPPTGRPNGRPMTGSGGRSSIPKH